MSTKLQPILQKICDEYDAQRIAYRKKHNQKNGQVIKASEVLYARMTEQKSYPEIGSCYGVSPERIRQLMGKICFHLFRGAKDTDSREWIKQMINQMKGIKD